MRCILKAHVRIRLVVSDHPDPRGGYSMRLGLVAYLGSVHTKHPEFDTIQVWKLQKLSTNA